MDTQDRPPRLVDIDDPRYLDSIGRSIRREWWSGFGWGMAWAIPVAAPRHRRLDGVGMTTSVTCVCGAQVPAVMMPLHAEDHTQAGHTPGDYR